MVGVIPRYCPAVTSHVTRRDSRGRRRGEEDGGPDVLREREAGCDDHSVRVRPETSPAWISGWLAMAGHRQCWTDQFSAVVGGRQRSTIFIQQY